MIDAICTPCRAAKEADVKTRIDLLQSVDTKGIYPRILLGLEIVGPLSDFHNSAEEIVRNVAEAKKQGVNKIVVHSPVTRGNYFGAPTNLSRSESVETLDLVFDIANRIGAKLVNVHAEIFLTTGELASMTEAARKLLLESISKNLRQVTKGQVGLAVENMPWPLMGDVFFTSSDMIWDPFFVDLEEIREFAEANECGITLDTCHWGTVSHSKVLLAEAVRRIILRLSHLHVSDVLGRWIDGTARFEEGIIPGDGDLGANDFRWLLLYLRNCEQVVSVTAEVNDRDFKNPEESRISLNRIFGWLR